MISSACLPGSVFAGDDYVPLERYERAERRVYREYVPEQPRSVRIIVTERPLPRIVCAPPVVAYHRIVPAPRLIVGSPCYTPVPSRYHAGGYHARIGTRIRY
jgi:hypothetical protein